MATMLPMVPQMAAFFAVNTFICFLALTAVGLRIYQHIGFKIGFGWDDGYILVSMTFAFTLLAVEGVRVGYPVSEIGLSGSLYLIKIITAHNILFVVSILTNKLSILCFYQRIFFESQHMRIMVRTLGAFFIIWACVGVVALFAVCNPRMAADGGETCNRGALMYNFSAFCIFGDLMVLVVPLPTIWHLNLNRHTKIKIMLLFLLGFIVTIIAILRCVSVIREDWTDIEFAIESQYSLAYAVLEPNLAILIACLPMAYSVMNSWRGKRVESDSNGVHLSTPTPPRRRRAAPGYDDLEDTRISV
ncbi:uncharacterized protein GGS25DRAFT_534770 [Hypoxylon fragiforme]|uniref:uncharacterized protein n=1 Tax=Hypoxylon fragiforme TaxID=63214 RepID=UPI0020C70384|nr:uncharacterized protein GGS25DRAFT_534770 [Hypoxylon fragiforme]KAI2604384.1 hypothetical protein GGS25DRAFT_534770 [Hypoxylon fragiforme]